MTIWLVVALTLLWLVVIALTLTVYALTRQIGVLYERVAPAGALMVNQALKAGDPAPKIQVDSLSGTSLNIGSPRPERSQLLFFLAPDCPICKSLLPVLKSLVKAETDVDVIFASDGGELAEHRAYVDSNDLTRFPYVVSETVGRGYGVAKLPYATLIGANGNISAMGIVNSREHLESLFEAESMGVGSIQDYLAQSSSDQYIDATKQGS